MTGMGSARLGGLGFPGVPQPALIATIKLAAAVAQCASAEE
jgi:hypothetical protein